jgi:adhesin/invasin
MHKSAKFPLFLLATVALAGAACSSDSSPTSPTSTTGTDTSTTSNGITIAIDSASLSDTAAVATAIPVRVRVTQNGSAVAGTTVVWTIDDGHGAISATSSLTDITGLATVSWTLGDTVGTNSLTAAISGASVTINATAVGGAASAIAKVSVDSDAVVAGAALPLTARVTDHLGNPTANATVVWTSSAGTLSADTSLSGSSGDATTNFTTPTTPGTYTVTASLPNIASVTFKIVAQ